MAKLKQYAVEVEEIVTHYLYVEARKPGGAEALIQTEEGWSRVTAYDEETPLRFDPKRMKITRVREA